MNNKFFWYSGIVAFFIYIAAVTLGGMLYPGYSHISQDISQLTSTNSPIRDLMNIFVIYNVLVSFLGIGLYRMSKNLVSKVAALFIIIIGILGVLITWFPIDTRGTQITSTGVVHIIIVSVVSLLTVASGFLFWFGYKNTKHNIFAKISLLSGLLFIISGPIAALNVLSPYAGLYERIPIGVFLLWMLTTSVLMLKQK